MSRKVLFDTDPGCDDAVMLAMALGLDEVEVVGLSTVCGNSTIDNTTRNARSILELGGYDVPVAQGCGRPLVDDLETAEWVHGEGGIRGPMPEPRGDVLDVHGADFIVEQAHEHGSDLTIAAVGPLSNLALAVAKEPRLPDLVDEIYLMGGSAFAHGNVTPMAEANFYNDPAAASRVVQDTAPKMVGLDVTTQASLLPSTVSAYQQSDGTLGVVGDWLDYPERVLDVDGGAPAIHDAAVVADIVDPSVLTFEPFPVEVDTTGGPSHGAVVADKYHVTGGADNCDVAVDIDVDRFRTLVSEGVDAYAASGDASP